MEKLIRGFEIDGIKKKMRSKRDLTERLKETKRSIPGEAYAANPKKK